MPLGLAGADQRVQLVDEQDDFAGGGIDFGQYRLEPLLEFAAILGAGNQRPHVEGHDPLRRQALGNVAPKDPDRQPLGDGSLADTRIADQHRVVLGPPAQHLHGAPDFVIAADDWIDLALTGLLRHIPRIPRQRLVAGLGAPAAYNPPLAHILDRRIQCLRRDSRRLQYRPGPDRTSASAVSSRSAGT